MTTFQTAIFWLSEGKKVAQGVSGPGARQYFEKER